MTLRLLIFAAVSAGAAFGLGLLALIYRSARHSQARWSDLITDPVTGGVSSTKLWTHVTNAVVLTLTARICWNAEIENALMVMSLFIADLALIGGSQAAMKALSARIGGAAPPGTTTTRSSLEEERVVTGDPAAPASMKSSKTVEQTVSVPAAVPESASPSNERTHP